MSIASLSAARLPVSRLARPLTATGAILATLLMGAAGSAPAQSDALPAPAPAVTAHVVDAGWTVAQARELLAAVEASEKEGLNPGDYDVAALRDAVERGQTGASLNAVANGSARALAMDYLGGRAGQGARAGWKIESPADPVIVDAGLATALQRDRLTTWLGSLLPRSDQYRALRTALAATPKSDVATRDLIRANMERWRWMPRNLGTDYVFVNVPAYRLDRIEGGSVKASYTVVVGAPKTPTPMLAAQVQSVVVNPWWTLPPSVLAEGAPRAGRKGYVWQNGRLRQKPGPQNALGQIKIDMPNGDAIYLHDTPAKAAFARADRALSHGCIRVQNVKELAADLAGVDPVELDAMIESGDTQTLPLQRSLPVYLTYFTAEVKDGRLVTYKDPYAKDAPVMAALDRPVALAAN